MKRFGLASGLAFVACSVLGSGFAAAAPPSATAEGLKDHYIDRAYPERTFKLKAGGQVGASSMTLAGQASYVGQFTTTLSRNPFGGFEGSITGASGDTLEIFGGFADLPSGEPGAYFRLVGGTGRFSNTYGNLQGPATLDEDDGMFTISVSGRINIEIVDP